MSVIINLLKEAKFLFSKNIFYLTVIDVMFLNQLEPKALSIGSK